MVCDEKREERDVLYSITVHRKHDLNRKLQLWMVDNKRLLKIKQQQQKKRSPFLTVFATIFLSLSLFLI